MKLRNVSHGNSNFNERYTLTEVAASNDRHLKVMQIDGGPVVYIEDDTYKIGGGAAGTCYPALNLSDPRHLLCLKVYHESTGRHAAAREYRFRSALPRHGPAAETMITAPSGRCLMLTNLALGTAGDLRKPLALPSIARCLSQVGRQLAAMHARNQSHQDLKLENILVAEDSAGALYFDLNDFDLACDLALGDTPGYAGKIWLPPERRGGMASIPRSLWHKVDVWSLGIACLSLLGLNPIDYDGPVGQGHTAEHYFATCEAIRRAALKKMHVGTLDRVDEGWDLELETRVAPQSVHYCQKAWCGILALPAPFNLLFWMMLSLDPERRPDMSEVVNEMALSGLLDEPQTHDWWCEPTAQRAAKRLRAALADVEAHDDPTFDTTAIQQSAAIARGLLQLDGPPRDLSVAPDTPGYFSHWVEQAKTSLGLNAAESCHGDEKKKILDWATFRASAERLWHQPWEKRSWSRA